jgi:hypothetical protein
MAVVSGSDHGSAVLGTLLPTVLVVKSLANWHLGYPPPVTALAIIYSTSLPQISKSASLYRYIFCIFIVFIWKDALQAKRRCRRCTVGRPRAQGRTQPQLFSVVNAGSCFCDFEFLDSTRSQFITGTSQRWVNVSTLGVGQ